MGIEKTTAVAAWESLFRAQVTVMRRLSGEFPAGQLSLNEYDVLFTLSSQPDRRLRLKELNEQVLLTQPSVSRLTDRLAARGLVDKCPDPGDGRGILVELTDEGFAVFRRVAARHMESITRQLSALDCEELTELTRLCTKLRLETARGTAGKRKPSGTPETRLAFPS